MEENKLKVGKLYYIYEEEIPIDYFGDGRGMKRPVDATFFFEGKGNDPWNTPFEVEQKGFHTRKIPRQDVIFFVKPNDSMPGKGNKYKGHKIVWNGMIGWVSTTKTIFKEANGKTKAGKAL
jgi:hypothetical protein